MSGESCDENRSSPTEGIHTEGQEVVLQNETMMTSIDARPAHSKQGNNEESKMVSPPDLVLDEEDEPRPEVSTHMKIDKLNVVEEKKEKETRSDRGRSRSPPYVVGGSLGVGTFSGRSASPPYVVGGSLGIGSLFIPAMTNSVMELEGSAAYLQHIEMSAEVMHFSGSSDVIHLVSQGDDLEKEILSPGTKLDTTISLTDGGDTSETNVDGSSEAVEAEAEETILFSPTKGPIQTSPIRKQSPHPSYPSPTNKLSPKDSSNPDEDSRQPPLLALSPDSRPLPPSGAAFYMPPIGHNARTPMHNTDESTDVEATGISSPGALDVDEEDFMFSPLRRSVGAKFSSLLPTASADVVEFDEEFDDMDFVSPPPLLLGNSALESVPEDESFHVRHHSLDFSNSMPPPISGRLLPESIDEEDDEAPRPPKRGSSSLGSFAEDVSTDLSEGGTSQSSPRSQTSSTKRYSHGPPPTRPPTWKDGRVPMGGWNRSTRMEYMEAEQRSSMFFVEWVADPEKEPDDVGLCGRIFNFCRDQYRKNEVFILVLVAICLARIYPPLGDEYVAREITATYVAVMFIFLLSGLGLKTEQFSHAFKQVKFNTYVQVFSFFVDSSIVFGVTRLLITWGVVGDALGDGMVICSCLPMTISSVAVLTKLSGGDEAAAVFNSAFGSMLSIVLTPSLVLMYLKVIGDVEIPEVFQSLAIRVITPVVIGQILQKKSQMAINFVAKYKIYFTKAQLYSVIFIVYTVFCKTFSKAEATPVGDVFIMILFQAIFHFLFIALTWFCMSYLFPKEPKLRVMGLYGTTQKTMAMGVPMIGAIYDGHPNVGLYTLPLLVWYPLQLIVGSSLYPIMRDFNANEKMRLRFEQDRKDEIAKKPYKKDDNNSGGAVCTVGDEDSLSLTTVDSEEDLEDPPEDGLSDLASTKETDLELGSYLFGPDDVESDNAGVVEPTKPVIPATRSDMSDSDDEEVMDDFVITLFPSMRSSAAGEASSTFNPRKSLFGGRGSVSSGYRGSVASGHRGSVASGHRGSVASGRRSNAWGRQSTRSSQASGSQGPGAWTFPSLVLSDDDSSAASAALRARVSLGPNRASAQRGLRQSAWADPSLALLSARRASASSARRASASPRQRGDDRSVASNSSRGSRGSGGTRRSVGTRESIRSRGSAGTRRSGGTGSVATPSRKVSRRADFRDRYGRASQFASRGSTYSRRSIIPESARNFFGASSRTLSSQANQSQAEYARMMQRESSVKPCSRNHKFYKLGSTYEKETVPGKPHHEGAFCAKCVNSIAMQENEPGIHVSEKTPVYFCKKCQSHVICHKCWRKATCPKMNDSIMNLFE